MKINHKKIEHTKIVWKSLKPTKIINAWES